MAKIRNYETPDFRGKITDVKTNLWVETIGSKNQRQYRRKGEVIDAILQKLFLAFPNEETALSFLDPDQKVMVMQERDFKPVLNALAEDYARVLRRLK